MHSNAFLLQHNKRSTYSCHCLIVARSNSHLLLIRSLTGIRITFQIRSLYMVVLHFYGNPIFLILNFEFILVFHIKNSNHRAMKSKVNLNSHRSIVVFSALPQGVDLWSLWVCLTLCGIARRWLEHFHSHLIASHRPHTKCYCLVYLISNMAQ